MSNVQPAAPATRNRRSDRHAPAKQVTPLPPAPSKKPAAKPGAGKFPVRTCIVLVMAWAVVAMRGKLAEARHIDGRELAFICLSGIATGASWLCYYYAIQNGVVSVVVPIDKLSILVAMAFSAVVFHERYTRRSLTGLALIVASTLAMAVFR